MDSFASSSSSGSNAVTTVDRARCLGHPSNSGQAPDSVSDFPFLGEPTETVNFAVGWAAKLLDTDTDIAFTAPLTPVDKEFEDLFDVAKPFDTCVRLKRPAVPDHCRTNVDSLFVSNFYMPKIRPPTPKKQKRPATTDQESTDKTFNSLSEASNVPFAYCSPRERSRDQTSPHTPT